MRLQSSLGRIYQNHRPDMFMSGYMAVAKVLKVHHYSGTADVILVNNNNVITSSEANNGKFAARMLTNGANFNNDTKKSWGVANPVAEGSLVVVAFLENMKHKPVILGQLHYADNENNILAQDYPLQEAEPGYHRREALKYLRVFPSYGYEKIDGEGNLEKVLPSKSFMKIVNTAADPLAFVSDNHLGFDHQHLSETEPHTGNVIEATDNNSKQPIKVLFVHRNFGITSGWTKVFMNDLGMSRFTRDNNDGNLSYWVMSPTGQFKFRRQWDSPYHENGSKNTEVLLDTDGAVRVKRKELTRESSFEIANTNAITVKKVEPTVTTSIELTTTDEIMVKRQSTVGTSSIAINSTNGIVLTQASGHTVTLDGNNIVIRHASGSYINLGTDVHIHAKGYITTSQEAP